MMEDLGPTKMDAVKPGYKTTEFWLSLIAILVGAVMASGAVVEDSPLAQGLGVVASVLGAMGYSVSRGMAKKGVKIFAVVVILGLVAGCCTVPAQAVKQIESTHDLVLPAYIKYVEADPSLDADQKDDRKKLAASLERLTDALKDHTED